MITFGLNYDVKPDHVPQFLATTREAIALVASLPGHEETRLYQDTAHPHSYMIYSKWARMEDFQAFIRSDAFRQVQTMGREMLSAAPKHAIYETRAMH